MDCPQCYYRNWVHPIFEMWMFVEEQEMEPIRKPLTVLVALLACGLPLDVASGDSKIPPPGFLKTHRGAGGSAEILQAKIAAEVADVVGDVSRIQHHNELLKQSVLLLQARLTRALQNYQDEVAVVAAANNSSVINNAQRMHAEAISNGIDVTPAVLTPVSMQTNSFLPAIARPDIVVEEEQPILQQMDVATATESRSETVAVLPIAETSADSFDAVSDEIVEPSAVGEQLAMNDNTLNDIRGGFTTTSGLQIAFGIERAVYVNGDLISTTSLNVVNLGNLPTVSSLPDVSKSVPDAAALTNSIASALPQANGQANNDAGASGASQPSATGSGAPVANSAATVTNNPSTTGSTAAAANATAQVASSATVPGNKLPDTSSASLALIQSGTGNTLQSGSIPASAVGTVIQNSLNNQKIQNITVISATVNSMEILKGLNLQSRISTAINESLTR